MNKELLVTNDGVQFEFNHIEIVDNLFIEKYNLISSVYDYYEMNEEDTEILEHYESMILKIQSMDDLLNLNSDEYYSFTNVKYHDFNDRIPYYFKESNGNIKVIALSTHDLVRRIMNHSLAHFDSMDDDILMHVIYYLEVSDGKLSDEYLSYLKEQGIFITEN